MIIQARQYASSARENANGVDRISALFCAHLGHIICSAQIKLQDVLRLVVEDGGRTYIVRSDFPVQTSDITESLPTDATHQESGNSRA